MGRDELLCLFDRQPRPTLAWRPAGPPVWFRESFRVDPPARSALSEPSSLFSPLLGRSDGAFFVSLTVAREREREGGKRVSGSQRAYCVVSIFSLVFIMPMPSCYIQLQRLSSIIDISSSFPSLLLSSGTLVPMRFSSLTTQDRCSSCSFFLLQYFEHHSSGGRADQLELLLLASGVILLHECCWKQSSSPPRDQLNAQLVNTRTTPSSSSSSSLLQI